MLYCALLVAISLVCVLQLNGNISPVWGCSEDHKLPILVFMGSYDYFLLCGVCLVT